MPAIRRRLENASVGVLLSLVVATVFAQPAAAADPTEQTYVKYYVVEPSYQGEPETLGEIASRFLGGSVRATEIFELNSDRVQPDGDKLTETAKLHAGWALMLPWDAYGAEVRYGLLPAATPASPDSARPADTVSPPADATAALCASTGTRVDGTQSQWGVLRIAPDHAWSHSRGTGVLVAVADSGVDASLPALSGRTTEGADIVSGTGRGNTDCLGSGTAMASLIAARSDAGATVTGVAPDATILPVRLVTDNPSARPVDQAAAIEFAIAAGARVIALGGYVTPTEPAVATAIARAAEHDVVVVLGASVTAAGGSPSEVDGVLRVGAVGIDGRPAAAYTPGGVDVVAPGVGVAALGISGTGPLEVTGTQYAVSFVAGEVALVRARFPQLTAAQVVHRVKATADPTGSSAGANEFGTGLINPQLAVTRIIPEENPSSSPPATPPQPAGSRPFRIEALIIMGVLALATAILLILRIRRIIRPDPPADAEPTTTTTTTTATAMPAQTTAATQRDAPRTGEPGVDVVPSRPTHPSTQDVSATPPGPGARLRAVAGRAGRTSGSVRNEGGLDGQS
jgi:membrane-anchored mycosin MYCP